MALDLLNGSNPLPVILIHPANFNLLSVYFALIHCNTAPISSSDNLAAKTLSIVSKSNTSQLLDDMIALVVADGFDLCDGWNTKSIFCQEVEGALIATANNACDGRAK
jgi:hypothetical protein